MAPPPAPSSAPATAPMRPSLPTRSHLSFDSQPTLVVVGLAAGYAAVAGVYAGCTAGWYVARGAGRYATRFTGATARGWETSVCASARGCAKYAVANPVPREVAITSAVPIAASFHLVFIVVLPCAASL